MSEEMKTKEQEKEKNEKVKTPFSRAKRKVLIFFGVAILFFVAISVLISALVDAFLGAVLGGIWIACILILALPSELKRVKRCFCHECGERYDYNRDVEWDVTEVEIKEKSTNPNSNRRQVVGIRIEHVDVECSCENCGATASFSHKFRTGEEYDDGHAKVQNIQTLVRKYFKV